MNTSETTASVSNSASKLADHSKNSANNVADAARKAGDELGTVTKAEFNNIMSDLQDLITRAGKLSGQELAVVRQQITDKMGVAKDKLHHISEDATAAAHKGVDATEIMIKERPFQAIGIAALAGLVLGCVINRR